jgi:hypothetical protein
LDLEMDFSVERRLHGYVEPISPTPRLEPSSRQPIPATGPVCGPGSRRRQSSRGRPPSSLVASPFPGRCYRFNPPVALPPLLRSPPLPPPSDSEASSTLDSITRHPFLISANRLLSPRYTSVPCAHISIEHPFPRPRHDARENTTSPLVSARHIPSSYEFLIPPTAARQTIKPRERPSSPDIARSPPLHPASAVCWDANPRDGRSRPVHGRRRIASTNPNAAFPSLAAIARSTHEYHVGPRHATVSVTEARLPRPGHCEPRIASLHRGASPPLLPLSGPCASTPPTTTSLESVPPRSTQDTQSTPSRATERRSSADGRTGTTHSFLCDIPFDST